MRPGAAFVLTCITCSLSFQLGEAGIALDVCDSTRAAYRDMMCCGSSSLRSVCVSPEVEVVQSPHDTTWLPLSGMDVTEVGEGKLPKFIRFLRGGANETCAVVHVRVSGHSVLFTCANGDVVSAGVEDGRRSADAPSAIYVLFESILPTLHAFEGHIDRYMGGMHRRIRETLTQWTTAPRNPDLMHSLIQLAEDRLFGPVARLLGFGEQTQETEGTEFTVSNYYAFASQLLLDFAAQRPAMYTLFNDSMTPDTGSASGDKMGPGPNTRSKCTFAGVRKFLSGMSDNIAAGNYTRTANLGNGVMNDYAVRPFLLAANVTSHRNARLVVEEMMDSRGTSPSSGFPHWSPAWVDGQVERFLGGHSNLTGGSTLHVVRDYSRLVRSILLKVTCNLDLTLEELDDFGTVASKALAAAFLPQGMIEEARTAHAIKLQELHQLRSKWADRIRDALRAHPSLQSLDPLRLMEIAQSVQQLTEFAGGLSVPSVMASITTLRMAGPEMLGAINAPTLVRELQRGDAQVDAWKSTCDQVVWETIRMYPPVLGVPVWDHGHATGNATGHATGAPERVVAQLHLAMHDASVFHDPSKFQLRAPGLYRQYSESFAESASHAAVGGDSRNCPGKELALAILSSFATHFLMQEWEVVGGIVGFGQTYELRRM